MPTFKISIFQHHQRRDGKFRVSIRLTHNRQSVYIKTDTYVTRKRMSADFKDIRDTAVMRLVGHDLLKYDDILLYLKKEKTRDAELRISVVVPSTGL